LVTIGKQSKNMQVASASAQNSDELGISVQTITPQLAEQFKLKSSNGVVVTEVTPFSIAAMAGIKPGTIILQANRKAVKNAAQFKRIIKENSAQKSIVLLILNDGYQHYVVLKWK